MSTPEEALAYIKKYNNVLEEKKKVPTEGGGEGGDVEGLGEGGENIDENQGLVTSEKSKISQGPGGHGSSMGNMVKREGSDNKLFAIGGETQQQQRGGGNSRLG